MSADPNYTAGQQQVAAYSTQVGLPMENDLSALGLRTPARWRGDLFSRCCDLLVEADDKQLLAILPLLRAVVKKDG